MKDDNFAEHPTRQLATKLAAFRHRPAVSELIDAIDHAARHGLPVTQIIQAYTQVGFQNQWDASTARDWMDYGQRTMLLTSKIAEEFARVTSPQVQTPSNPLLQHMFGLIDAENREKPQPGEIYFGFPAGRQINSAAGEQKSKNNLVDLGLVIATYVQSMFPLERGPEEYHCPEVVVVPLDFYDFVTSRLMRDLLDGLHSRGESAAARLLADDSYRSSDNEFDLRSFLADLMVAPQWVFDITLEDWIGQPITTDGYPVALGAFVSLLDTTGTSEVTNADYVLQIDGQKRWRLSAANRLKRLAPCLGPIERVNNSLGWDRSADILKELLEQHNCAPEKCFPEFLIALGEWSDHSESRLPLSFRQTQSLLLSWTDAMHGEILTPLNYEMGPGLLDTLARAPTVFVPLVFSIFEEELGLTNVWHHSKDGSASVNYSKLGFRHALYLKLVIACEQLGLEELASALVAFLLTSHYVITRRSALTRADHAGLLNRARNWRGWGMIENSIRSITEPTVAESEPAVSLSLDRLWLTSHVSKGQPNPGRPEMSDHGRALLNAIEAVGKTCWMGLTVQTKQLFTEHFMTWEALHQKAGSGKRNWGPSAMEATSAIELELIHRLAKLFGSTEYTEHEKSRNQSGPPTLGTVNAMLRKGFPEIIQDDVVKCIPALAEKETQKLLGELTRLRNDAAHGGGFDSKKFMRVREILFDEKLVRRLFPNSS